MRTYQAIVIAALLIGALTGGSIMWINRYEIAQPFSPVLFTRFDRWTGRVQLCSSRYDNKTYCDGDLTARTDEAVKAAHAAANLTFRTLGYSQDQINHWPPYLLERARNLAANGIGDDDIAKFLQEQHVSPPSAANKPTADDFVRLPPR